MCDRSCIGITTKHKNILPILLSRNFLLTETSSLAGDASGLAVQKSWC